MEISRIAEDEKGDGQLNINEIEYYEGYIGQVPVPSKFMKMKSPRTPAPQLVTCSNFDSQLFHCFKAFDGISSSNSSWKTTKVGSKQYKTDLPHWVVLDMGQNFNKKVHPTAVRIVCGASDKSFPRGCPVRLCCYCFCLYFFTG